MNEIEVDFFEPEPFEEAIEFFSEEINFELTHSESVSKWLKSVAEEEKMELRHIVFIFCSDNYLHQMNVTYLKHDSLTDVITFPYATDVIEGDIFISIDRVEYNAQKLKIDFKTELHRVMVHGVLHLCGYTDKTKEKTLEMRAKENYYLPRIY